MRRDCASRLLDMLVNAHEAVEFADRFTFEEFIQDRLPQNAISKSLQNIGEAANHLPREFRDEIPEIAWNEIRGMRHRLVHENSIST